MTASAGGENRSRDVIEETARQFEEETRRLEGIASRLKPFVAGRASPADYDEIKSFGLPRPFVVFFLTATPQPALIGVFPSDLLIAKTICDEPFGLHLSVEEMVVSGSLGPGGLEKKPQLAPSFEPLARLYGYAGGLIWRAQQNPQVLAGDIVHVLSQGKSNLPALLQEAAVQVAAHGPDTLDKLSLNQPTRDVMRRLLDKGVPIFLQGLRQEIVSIYTSGRHRTASSKEIDDAGDLLVELGVFWLLRFQWRWCTYRKKPHWYIAGQQKQYGCVRHRDAVQQDRFRHPGTGGTTAR